MNSLVHDELVLIRHTLDTLRNEVEYLRMTITDLGPDKVDYAMIECHMDLMALGVKIKSREQALVRKL